MISAFEVNAVWVAEDIGLFTSDVLSILPSPPTELPNAVVIMLAYPNGSFY